MKHLRFATYIPDNHPHRQMMVNAATLAGCAIVYNDKTSWHKLSNRHRKRFAWIDVNAPYLTTTNASKEIASYMEAVRYQIQYCIKNADIPF